MKNYWILLLVIGLSSCQFKPPLGKTNLELKGQTAPPDMVFVPGNGKIDPFYIGVSEEINLNYVTYLDWLRSVFVDYPEVAEDAKIKFKNNTGIAVFNDPAERYHMEHPAFAYYPVVGATWHQIQNYLQWKSDRLNEAILIELGFLQFNSNQMNEENFNLEAYLYEQYNGFEGKTEIIKNGSSKDRRKISWGDGILTAGYRLPTEAEWEMLENETIGNDYSGNYPYGKNYFTFRWMNQWEKTRYNDYVDEQSMPNYRQHWKENGIAKVENTEQYKQGLQGPYLDSEIQKPGNVAGNVREWLLDLYKESTQTNWKSMADYLAQNDFETDELKMSRLYDQDGILDLKDDLGRMSFRILGINTDGTPLWVQGPRYQPYLYEYVYDINKKTILLEYLHNYQLTLDSSVYYKRFKKAIYFYYQNQPKNLGKQHFWLTIFENAQKTQNQHNFNLTEMQDMLCFDWFLPLWQDEKNNGVVGFSLFNGHSFYPSSDHQTYYYYERYGYQKQVPNTSHQEPRLIRGGTWKEPNFKYRAGLSPDSSRTDIGFRCLLPYIGTPVKKEYKVKWK